MGGDAVAWSEDPWIFTPDEQTDLRLRIRLTNVRLHVVPDPDMPDEPVRARVDARFAFGAGDQPGSNVIIEGAFSHEVTNEDPVFVRR
ncbi:MAG: hypothetical protein M3463_18705 [Verrucomicrobiota bacterium]|nr:hypothetical protein [Verrucomicrobiota bacterium]